MTNAATTPSTTKALTDDTYIAGFDGFVFGPVQDDPLASLLHPVNQLR